MVDTFYQQFLFFADYDILVGFKLDEQVFDDTGLDSIVGGGSPNGWSVSDDIHGKKYIGEIGVIIRLVVNCVVNLGLPLYCIDLNMLW